MLPVAFTLAIGWLPHDVVCNASACFDTKARLLSTDHSLSEVCGEADMLHASLDALMSVYAVSQTAQAEMFDAVFASFDLEIERRQHYGGALRGTLLVSEENFVRFLLALDSLDLCVFGTSVVPASYVR
jgi:hypothetical protein